MYLLNSRICILNFYYIIYLTGGSGVFNRGMLIKVKTGA
jgi:hypothetical protein